MPGMTNRQEAKSDAGKQRPMLVPVRLIGLIVHRS